jgi:hypothetical protein
MVSYSVKYSRFEYQLKHAGQPTAFEMRQKNAAFNNNVRAGKNPTKPSRAEIAAKRSPVGNTSLT